MIFVIGAYAVAALVLVIHLFAGTSFLKRLSQALLLLCACTHLAYTIRLGISIGEIPVVSIQQALNVMVLFASIFFVFAVLMKNSVSFGVFFSPFAAFVLSLISNKLDTHSIIASHFDFWFRFHTICVISGDALFIIAGIASLFYIIHYNLIKKGLIHKAASDLPPLAFLDKVTATSLALGFVAITAGMIIGGLWATEAGLDLLRIAPKISTGAVTWLIMAFTLHQRFAIGWRGYRTAIMTFSGLAVSAGLTILIAFIFPGAHGLRILP